MRTLLIYEILEQINKNPETIKNYLNNTILRDIFRYSFNEDMKFVLPDGEPPYKKPDVPAGMGATNFYQVGKKLNIFARADLTPIKRETIFVQALETLCPAEAALLLAIKDQQLTKLYNNITKDLVKEFL